MTETTPISLLMIGTLLAVLVIGIVMLLRFRAKQPHHPMEGQRERNIDEIRDEGPSA